MVTFYSPAEVTELTGFSVDTLRYYEKCGVLRGIERTAGGRRRFSDDDVGFLRMMRCLRDTDMPIADMVRYADLMRGGDAFKEERLAVLRQHDERVTAQIEQLLEHQRLIRYKIALYSGEQEVGQESAAVSA